MTTTSGLPTMSEYLREVGACAAAWRSARRDLAAVVASAHAAGVTYDRLSAVAELEAIELRQLVREHRAVANGSGWRHRSDGEDGTPSPSPTSAEPSLESARTLLVAGQSARATTVGQAGTRAPPGAI